MVLNAGRHPGEQFHTVPSGRANQGKSIFLRQRYGFLGRRSLTGENGNAGANGPHNHISGNTSAGIYDALCQINIVVERISDGFIQRVMSPDVFTLEDKIVSLCQKTAVHSYSLTIQRQPLAKAIHQAKKLARFPWNRVYRADI